MTESQTRRLGSMVQQDGHLGATTPRRSRVSSIFQQKTIRPDDIDADLLKHLQFAAQRASTTMSPPVTAAHQQTDSWVAANAPGTALEQIPALPEVHTSSLAGTRLQPIAAEEFTLAKIEQSIADIEAELGWTSLAPAQKPSTATVDTTPEESSRAAAAPATILNAPPANRNLHVPQAAATGTSTATPAQPQVKRLSFLGELTTPEPAKGGSQIASPAAVVKPEPRSSLTVKSVITAAAVVAESVERRVTIESASSAGQSSVAAPAAAFDRDAPRLSKEGSRTLGHSLSEANLDVLSSRSLDSARRQLTSLQSDAAHDGSKRRAIKHSVSGKITPSGGSATSGGYTSRYATRQLSLSGRASPILSETATSGKRSLIASPTGSLHGGQASVVQLSGKPGVGRLAPAAGAEEQPGVTLAGAAAVLKTHARPSALEGAGWHLATGDGLPFSPRGSLVASSGGSRSLQPIASQQEALFDAEGNRLPRQMPVQQAEVLRSDLAGTFDDTASQPSCDFAAAVSVDASKVKEKGHTKFGAKQEFQAAASKKQDLIGTKVAEHDEADVKHKPKHSMLSIVMFPCFCLQPRTMSAEDPYSHGSLRQRYTAKETSALTASDQVKSGGKGMPAPKSVLKQKQPPTALLTEPSRVDWDLGTQVHQADQAGAAVSTADVQLAVATEQQAEGLPGTSLQGAISLAPKRAGFASAQGVPASLQTRPSMDDVVSPGASFTSQHSTRSWIPETRAGPQASGPDSESHADAQLQSRTQTQSESESLAQARSASHEEEATSAAPSTAAESLSVSHDGGMKVDFATAGGSGFAWGHGTGHSELNALGMTGRSGSSKSTTRHRKEWEGPEVGTPDEVSQSLEDIMLERFPELQPLLLQTSFTNKAAPWRPTKSAHTSHAPTRANSLGVSREASFTPSRPESRHGHLPMSHLGAQSPEAILPELPVLGTVDQAQLPHDSSSMSEQNSAQHGRVDSMEAAMGDCSSVGTQSAEGEGQMDDSHNSMPLVEAAAIGASSPGAFVRVPTSTALSQADQIALRYHNQVQLQLQQATGSTAVVPKLGRLNSKSPARRGPTKHRPFHLSESPWTSLSSGSAPLGHSQPLPSAPGSPSSLRNTRPLSETPTRTARPERFASDKQATASQKKAKESPVNGRSPNKRLAERQSGRVERQNVVSVSSTADEGSQRGHSPDVMSFGSYGGVSFSSFAPALPTDAASAAGLGAEEDNDWADDSGKWGELTRNKQAHTGIGRSAAAASSPKADLGHASKQHSIKRPASAAAVKAAPKKSSISLTDIAADESESDDGVPDQARGGSGMGGGAVQESFSREGVEDSRSSLSLLESLAQESNAGFSGNSDCETGPAAAQTPKQSQSWREIYQEMSARMQLSNQAAAKPVTAEASHVLSEVSLNFDNDAVEMLLPDEASDAHMHSAAPSEWTQAPAVPASVPFTYNGAMSQSGSSQAAQAEQPSSLALALAALAASAAQQQQSQQAMMPHPVPDAALSMASPAAEADEDVSLSSASTEDVLADAAAAAVAAGLSRRQEVPPPSQQAPQVWVPESSVVTSPSSQAPLQVSRKPLPSAATFEAAGYGPSEAEIQSQLGQQAQQEGKQQRESASGDWPGPGSSGPSWSGAAGNAHGVGRFQHNQTVNYVGKSARRSKVVAPPPKVGRLQGLFSKLRRGSSREEEDLDLSRPASIAGPRPVDSQAELVSATKSGSWMPKVFSRPSSGTVAQSASSSTPKGRTRFTDEPPLATQVAQPDLHEAPTDGNPSVHGALPPSKPPPEIFTALPSMPVPATIAADPVSSVTSGSAYREGLAASAHGSASKGMKTVVHQTPGQHKSVRQSSSGSGSDDDISEMSI